jgi:2-hydroxychromene-2-carboxylate isomerase
VSAVEQPVFFYDLASPECYLAAESILSVLPVVPEWEPVIAAELGLTEATDRIDIEARAAAQGLMPLRWPPHVPPDSALAIRVATYAKRGGRAVAFSQAAFRQAFAGGRDLGEEATVLIAAAACEMHPAAVLKGMALRSVTEGMARARDRARATGVDALPAITVGQHVFCGRDALAQAAHELGVGP